MKQTDRASTYILRKRMMSRQGYLSYDEFLKSDLWEEIKLAQKTTYKNGDKCCFCGTTESIHLHHVRYGKNNFVRAIMKNLLPACGKCHYNIHCLGKEFNIDTKRATLVYNIIYFPESPQFTWESAPKEREEERVLSMRIVERSGLPETLHHSIHACLSSWSDLTPEEFLKRYLARKSKRRDQVMLDLVNIHRDQLETYLRLTLNNATTE